MSLVSELAQDPSFIERVKVEVTKALLLNSSETVETDDGPIEGAVTAYRIDDDFSLAVEDGTAFEWTFSFKGVGDGTIDYLRVDGSDGQVIADGEFEGSIRIDFADSSLGDEFESIAATAEIEVESLSAHLDVVPAVDDPE